MVRHSFADATRPTMLAAMVIYVAEAYLSRARASELESMPERLRDALTVRHLFSYFVPEEETAFHVLEGSTADAVREALERAGITPDRVVVAETLESAREQAPAPGA